MRSTGLATGVHALYQWALDPHEGQRVRSGQAPHEVFLRPKGLEGFKVSRRDTADPGPGFVMLDRTLAHSLSQTISGELKRTTAAPRASKAEKNEMLGGCEGVLQMHTYCAASRCTTQLYGFSGSVSNTLFRGPQTLAFKASGGATSRVKNVELQEGRSPIRSTMEAEGLGSGGDVL